MLATPLPCPGARAGTAVCREYPNVTDLGATADLYGSFTVTADATPQLVELVVTPVISEADGYMAPPMQVLKQIEVEPKELGTHSSQEVIYWCGSSLLDLSAVPTLVHRPR